jgi:hypothetical protein
MQGTLNLSSFASIFLSIEGGIVSMASSIFLQIFNIILDKTPLNIKLSNIINLLLSFSISSPTYLGSNSPNNSSSNSIQESSTKVNNNPNSDSVQESSTKVNNNNNTQDSFVEKFTVQTEKDFNLSGCNKSLREWFVKSAQYDPSRDEWDNNGDTVYKYHGRSRIAHHFRDTVEHTTSYVDPVTGEAVYDENGKLVAQGQLAIERKKSPTANRIFTEMQMDWQVELWRSRGYDVVDKDLLNTIFKDKFTGLEWLKLNIRHSDNPENLKKVFEAVKANKNKNGFGCNIS